MIGRHSGENMKVYLYSTAGCHLCDLAKAVIWPLLVKHDFRLIEVDVSEQDELVNRYGVRIPVLGSSLIGRELDWPFSVKDIDDFFTELESL